MSLIKAILWDMDGTLIDSESFYFSAWQKVLKNYAIHYEKETWLREMSGKTTQQVYFELVSRYHLDVEWEPFFQQIKDAVTIQYKQDKVDLMPYAREALIHLKSRGIQLGLVTSSYRQVMETHLKSLLVYDFFDFYVTKDDVTKPKPNPEPYLLAQKKLVHLSPQEILVFEDSTTGITSAVDAGLTCVGIHADSFIRERLPTPFQYESLMGLFQSSEFLAPIS